MRALPNAVSACLVAAVLLGAVGPSLAQERAPAEAPACVHELVYTPFGGLILLKVTIAGSPPLDFVLDSGATQSAITDPFLAQALGLELRETGLARGVGAGASRVLIADDTSVYADGVELARVALVVHDIGERLAELAGREIHGFLGAELFERYVVEIDPAGSRVLFYDPALYAAQGEGLVLPLTVEDRRPVVEGTVRITPDGKVVPVRLMVDTGSSRNLSLIVGSRRRLKPPEDAAPSASFGIIGETSVVVSPIARLELGPLVSERLETSWMGAHQVPAVRNIPDLNGILGNGLLGRLHAVFDYGRGRLVLTPLP